MAHKKQINEYLNAQESKKMKFVFSCPKFSILERFGVVY